MKKEKTLVKRRSTPVKKRSSAVYNKKVARITKWYNRVLKIRETPAIINKNTKVPSYRKELKPLDFYISKIRKINEK